MLHTDFSLDIGATTPFAPALAEGLQRLLGERPDAARHMLIAGDGGTTPAPKPTPKPKPAATKPATHTTPTHSTTPTPTRSTDQARTGATHTTPKAKPKPAPKPAPKPKPVLSERDEITQMKIAAGKQRIKAMQAEAAKPKPKAKAKPAPKPAPVLSERDEITQMKIAAGKQRLKLMQAEARKVDGKHLDKQVPPEQRLSAYQKQQQLQHKLDKVIAPTKPPKGLTGQALHVWNELEKPEVDSSKHQQALKLQQQYWSKHDTYVDSDGTVFAAKFNPTTGTVDLERHDTVKTRPPAKVVARTKAQQQALHQQVVKAQQKAQADFNRLPGGIRNAEFRDGPSQAERDAAIKRQIEAKYYAKHPVHVGKDGTISSVALDPATGQPVLTEQPDSLDVTRTQNVYVDGSRTRTSHARGWLSNGVDDSTMTEDVGRDGKVRGTTTNHKRDTRTGNVQTVLDESMAYDAKGVQTHGDKTVTVNDDDHHQKTVAKTSQEFTHGRLATQHSTVDVTGDGPEKGTKLDSHSTTDAKFNRKGQPTYLHTTQDTTISGTTKGKDKDPDVEWSQVEHGDTLYDGKGKSIVGKDGEFVVTPVSTLDRTSNTRVKGGGQDDGTDEVIVTTSHAKSDATGTLVFDPMSHTKDTSEGKDGAKGRSYDSPIDPKTGAPVEDPPADWKSPQEIQAAKNGYPLEQYMSADDIAKSRKEAWTEQNVDKFDDRSGWRKFKDGATKFAGIGAAVLGTALLFTGVGTAVGAGLLVGAAALGTFAAVSTAVDYKTGRNHVSGMDVALSAAMAIPGVGGGAARLGARAIGVAAKLGEGAKGARALMAVGRAFDTSGKLMTGGYAGFTTIETGKRALSGEPIGTMDVLNVLAAYGGAKHAFVKPTGTSPATHQGAPKVRMPEDPSLSTPRLHHAPEPTETLVAGEHGPGQVTFEHLLANGKAHGITAPDSGQVKLASKGEPNEVVYASTASGTIRGYTKFGADGKPELMVRQDKDGGWTTTRPTDGTLNPKTVETRAALPTEIPVDLPAAHVRALVDGRSDAIRAGAGDVTTQLSHNDLIHVTRRHGAGFRETVGKLGRPEDGRIYPADRGGRDGKGEPVNDGDGSAFAPTIKANDIQKLVADTLEHGTWMLARDGVSRTVVLDTGRVIGTDIHGNPTTHVSVVVNGGRPVTAYPSDVAAYRIGLRNDPAALASDAPREYGRDTMRNGGAQLEPPIAKSSEVEGQLHPNAAAVAARPELYTGQIRVDGKTWQVHGAGADGRAIVSRVDMHRPTSIDDIIELNPSIVERAGGADAVRQNPALLNDQYLVIRRTDGTIQTNWTTTGEPAVGGRLNLDHHQSRYADAGELIAGRAAIDPTFDGRAALRDLLTTDPSLLFNRPLRLRRSSTSIAEGRSAHTIDDGWSALSAQRDANGDVTLTLAKQYRYENLPANFQAKARAQGTGPGQLVTVERAGVAIDDILDFNRARLEGNHGQIPNVQVYAYSPDGAHIGTNRDLQSGPATARADQAVVHTRAALDYLYSRYGYTPSGGDIKLVIDAANTHNNASMQSQGNILRIGTHDSNGGAFDPSVLMHELGHKVVDDLTAGRYETDESGSLHEGIADVFAAAWTHDPVIGRVFDTRGNGAIRDVQSGSKLLGTRGEWNAVQQAKHGVEPHTGSGVVSGVASRISDTLGWSSTGDLFYDALRTGALKTDMSFSSLSDALRLSAARRYGIQSPQYRDIAVALDKGGLLGHPPVGMSVSRLTSRDTVEHGLRVVGYAPNGNVLVMGRFNRTFEQSPSQLLLAGGRGVTVGANGRVAATSRTSVPGGYSDRRGVAAEQPSSFEVPYSQKFDLPADHVASLEAAGFPHAAQTTGSGYTHWADVDARAAAAGFRREQRVLIPEGAGRYGDVVDVSADGSRVLVREYVEGGDGSARFSTIDRTRLAQANETHLAAPARSTGVASHIAADATSRIEQALATGTPIPGSQRSLKPWSSGASADPVIRETLQLADGSTMEVVRHTANSGAAQEHTAWELAKAFGVDSYLAPTVRLANGDVLSQYVAGRDGESVRGLSVNEAAEANVRRRNPQMSDEQVRTEAQTDLELLDYLEYAMGDHDHAAGEFNRYVRNSRIEDDGTLRVIDFGSSELSIGAGVRFAPRLSAAAQERLAQLGTRAQLEDVFAHVATGLDNGAFTRTAQLEGRLTDGSFRAALEADLDARLNGRA